MTVTEDSAVSIGSQQLEGSIVLEDAVVKVTSHPPDQFITVSLRKSRG